MEKTSCEENYPFSPFIEVVLRQVETGQKSVDLKKLDPKTTCLGPETLCLVNDLIQEFFEMLILEVNTLVKKKEHEGEGEGEICNKIFTTVYDVQEAARRVIPGELERHAISEGARATTRYINRYKNDEKKTVSEKAGLEFCCDLVERMMKRGCGFEFETEFEGMKGCVYMAAVLEYMTAEIVELSGKKASEENEKIITVDHLQQAIHLDDGELASLFDGKMERYLGIGIKGGE